MKSTTPFRCLGPLALSLAGAMHSRPAAALDIESVRAFGDMNAHPSNRVYEDGSSVQWWPVNTESGGWSLTVVRRDAALAPLWQVSVPIPADAVSIPSFRSEGDQAVERVSHGLRESVAAEVVLGPGGDALVAYVDGFALLGVPVSAEGSPSDARELATVAEGAYSLASSSTGDRLALVSKGQLTVFDNGGNTAFSAELGKGLRDIQAVFMPDGHVVVGGNRGQDEAAAFEWYDGSGQRVHTTDFDLFSLNGETLTPLLSGEQQYLLAPSRRNPSASGSSTMRPLVAFTALPMSLDEANGVTRELGSDEARRSGSGNDHYRTKQDYRPGATAILGVVPDGEGGLIYALRGSRILATVATENGVPVGAAFDLFYSGELVAERMDADGNILWSTVIPERQRSSVLNSDAETGHVGIHEGRVTLLNESEDCGGKLYRSWCHVAIDATDGAILDETSYRRFLPRSGIYVPQMSWTAPDGVTVYTFRGHPKVGAFKKTYATDSGYMIRVDTTAPGPGFSLANPLAIRGEGPQFEAGREFGLAADVRHPLRRPMVKGVATGSLAAFVVGLGATRFAAANDFSDASTAAGVVTAIGVGGFSARYIEKHPGKWWATQSSDFQAGYSSGYPRRSLRRATIGGAVAGLYTVAIQMVVAGAE